MLRILSLGENFTILIKKSVYDAYDKNSKNGPAKSDFDEIFVIF